MAKMQGLTGKMSGKMGSVVFRVRQGEQIVTQYNPIVKNPNTPAQSTQRGAFKLMSQLAATMAPAIINRPARNGQSPRNRFVQQNFPLVEADSENAKIEMNKLQLTSSSSFLGDISIESNQVTIEMIPANVTKVRFVEVSYPEAGNSTKPVISQMSEVNVVEGSASFNTSVGNTVLAYGLIPTSGAAKVSLDNINVDNNEPYVAQILLERLVASGSVVVTETLGINAISGN